LSRLGIVGVAWLSGFGLGGLVRGSRAAAAARAGGPATVDHDHGALDGHPGRAYIDESSRSLQTDLHPGFDDDLHSGLEMDFHAGVNGMFLAYLLLLVTADGERLASTDILFTVSRNRQARVFLNRFLFFPLMTMS